MQIEIIALGKIREKYLKVGIEDFSNRLRAYCSLKIVEISSQSVTNEMLIEKYKRIEANKILDRIEPCSFVVAMDICGQSYSSNEFAKFLDDMSKSGLSKLVFIIGSSNGLDGSILEFANIKMSMSKMTFAHQIARLILIEQIYRGFKILKNEPYHK